MMTPVLPSGVLSGVAVLSIPASAGDMMIEVPKPVAVRAAVKAHFSFSAVIKTRPAHMGKISAKVSTTSTNVSGPVGYLMVCGYIFLYPYFRLALGVLGRFLCACLQLPLLRNKSFAARKNLL